MYWKSLEFENVLSDVTSGNPKVQKKDYKGKGLFPVIDQGKEYSSGYSDDEQMIFKGELPVLVFGDHTRIIKYVDEKFCLGADGIRVLKPKKHFDPKFLFYFLILVEIPNKGYSRHFKYLKEFSFPFPSLSEQQRIVEILDQADEIRKLRKKVDEKAERIIPALFYEMFGDIVSSNFPKRKIGEIAKRITKGESPNWQGFKYQTEGIRFITSENVRDGFLDLSNSKFIPEAFDKKLARSQLLENDVLINLVGASIGRAAIVTKESLPANINQAVAAVTLDQSLILPTFLLNQILHPFIQAIIKGNRVEGARANISLTNVRQLEVIIPDIHLQIDFDKKIKLLTCIKKECSKSEVNIESLFNTILYKAFDGSLTASWREAHMKELLKEMEEQKNYLEKVN